MPRLPSLLRGRSFASAVGVLSILALGGCPVAQTPRVPQQQDQQQQQPAPSQQPGGGQQTLPRPIPPPPTGGSATSGPGTTTPINEPPPGGGGGQGGGQGGGGQGGGGQTGGTANVQVDGPTADQYVDPTLPGAQPVNIAYQLQGLGAGLITKVELVAARDNDQDGQPDNGQILEGLVQPLDTQQLSDGSNTASFDAQRTIELNLLSNGFGRFLVGIRIFATDGSQKVAWAEGRVIVDTVAPTLVSFAPTQDLLHGRDKPLAVSVQTQDNSEHTIQILLDPDGNPDNGNEVVLLTRDSGGTSASISEQVSVALVASGTYTLLFRVSDGVHGVTAHGGIISLTRRLIGTIDLNDLGDRGFVLQGVNLNDLAGSSMAAVPDLNGDGSDEFIVASRFGKPYRADLSFDGVGFGSAYMVYGSGADRLEAGRTLRLSDVGAVDQNGMPAAGAPLGVIFMGIRTPVSVAPGPDPRASLKWTEGLADMAVIPDMDGDDLPEIVFGFPRVESVSLIETDPRVMAESTFPIGTPGLFELDAFDPINGEWFPNLAQFTRGGIVIVSSHNLLLKDPLQLDERGARTMDLQTVGQRFFVETAGGRAFASSSGYVPYVRRVVNTGEMVEVNCNGDPNNLDQYPIYEVQWDIVMNGQGPGGFLNGLNDLRFRDLEKPPLANIPVTFGISVDAFNMGSLPPPDSNTAICDLQCTWVNSFFSWNDFRGAFPCIDPALILDGNLVPGDFSWYPFSPSGMGDPVPWTGFYAVGESVAVQPDPVNTIGARILGQRVGDQFGWSVSSTSTHLYMAAPKRSARAPLTSFDNDNVEILPDADGVRDDSGVVYEMVVRNFPGNALTTQTQLWIEPGTRTFPDPNANDPNVQITVPLAYPYHDAEDPDAVDYTMPTPHQYIIDEVGYLRGNDVISAGERDPDINNDRITMWGVSGDGAGDFCGSDSLDGLRRRGGGDADTCIESPTYTVVVGDAFDVVDNVQQIVGPHEGAQITLVRSMRGSVNGDVNEDVAFASPYIRQPTVTQPDPNGLPQVRFDGPEVGGVFILFRESGRPGDVLLERMALDPADSNRVKGVFIYGAQAGMGLGSSLASAGDVNGDGFADVIFGGPQADPNGVTDAGAVFLVFGSSALISPVGGWSTAELLTAPGVSAVRFVGENAGDLAGSNIASADVDGDGYSDLLIAAPGAEGGRGAVYLIYGSEDFQTRWSGQTLHLAQVGTALLPGAKFVGRAGGDQLGGGEKTVTGIDPSGGSVTVTSQGIARLGDIDGDGREDFAISAMLADPQPDKVDAGEVYVLYGRGD